MSKVSPTKMELAPAKKHSACVSSLMAVRPAESRTCDFGIMMRASAIVRTNSIGSIGSASPSGVPSIGISMLIGTLSGGSGRLAKVTSMSMRSALSSPMPTMPPQQTLMPLSRTLASVSNRSAKVRVEITSL